MWPVANHVTKSRLRKHFVVRWTSFVKQHGVKIFSIFN